MSGMFHFLLGDRMEVIHLAQHIGAAHTLCGLPVCGERHPSPALALERLQARFSADSVICAACANVRATYRRSHERRNDIGRSRA